MNMIAETPTRPSTQQTDGGIWCVLSADVLKDEGRALGQDVYSLPDSADFKLTGWQLPEPLRGNVDVGVVVSFGYMIPSDIIASFPLGMINIHPSILPKYRGSSPIQYSLWHGDKEGGVSIIDLHPTKIDAGNILSQSKMIIDFSDSYATLAPRLAQQGAQQLLEVLSDLPKYRDNSLAQKLADIPDNPDSSSTNPFASLLPSISSAPRIYKSQSELDFTRFNALHLYRTWAALHGFLRPYTSFQGHRIIIHQAVHPDDAKIREETDRRQEILAFSPSTAAAAASSTICNRADAERIGVGGLFYDTGIHLLGVICADHSIFYVHELMMAHKKQPVSASVFAHGYLDKRKLANPEDMLKWKFLPLPPHRPLHKEK